MRRFTAEGIGHSAPFLQRLFGLACDGGFTGQITSNSFMKREFGKKLIAKLEIQKDDIQSVLPISKVIYLKHSTSKIILT